jgi:TldD protein
MSDQRFAAFATVGHRALAIARRAVASWADVRLAVVEVEELAGRNGELAGLEQEETTVFGVRVMVDGAWGFASAYELTKAEVDRVGALAVALAKAGRQAGPGRHRWAEEPAWKDRWSSTWLIDPFTVPLDRKLDLLMRGDAIPSYAPPITATATACTVHDRVRVATGLDRTG